MPQEQSVETLDLPLERDAFLRTLLRHLSGALEDAVGLREASGFVSIVAQKLADELNRDYRIALSKPGLSRSEVARVVVDLKRRIQGDFYILEESDEKIVLGNRKCPFGEKVAGRPSLCMMTSTVLGVIAAENLGYSKVVLDQTIARGNSGCRIVLHLKPTLESELAEGTEFARRGP
jgi:hypothetical protein